MRPPRYPARVYFTPAQVAAWEFDQAAIRTDMLWCLPPMVTAIMASVLINLLAQRPVIPVQQIVCVL